MSFNERLITAVSKYPFLYDKTAAQHKSSPDLNEAWRRVAHDIGEDGRLLMINVNYIFQPIC